MPYREYYYAWNNTFADDLANIYYSAMLSETEKAGFPVLDTEGGPGTTTRAVNGTITQCPDQVLPNASGYCRTNLYFIQTLTSLMESHAPDGFNWLWWPVGDWSDTPGAGILGALATDGWAEQITWNKIPAQQLVLSVEGNGTIFPAPGNYSYIAGAVVNITAIPATGNIFSTWDMTNGISSSNPLQLQVNSYQIVKGIFKPVGTRPLTNQPSVWTGLMATVSANVLYTFLGSMVLGAGLAMAIFRRTRSTAARGR
jgi:Divergent InlB B-repeat domain